MKRIATTILVLSLCLSLLTPVAFAQGYYQNGSVPGLVNDYPQPIQQALQGNLQGYSQGFAPQQINQFNLPTQVPYNQSSQYATPDQIQPYDGQAQPAVQNNMPQNQQGFEPIQKKMTAYQQQEMALNEASTSEQLNELKQRRESEESLSGGINDHQSEKKQKKEKRFSGVGTAFKDGLVKYGAPAAGAVGSFFLLRAALHGSMMPGGMMVPGGGMMVMPPGSMVVMPR